MVLKEVSIPEQIFQQYRDIPLTFVSIELLFSAYELALTEKRSFSPKMWRWWLPAIVSKIFLTAPG